MDYKNWWNNFSSFLRGKKYREEMNMNAVGSGSHLAVTSEI